MDYYPNAPLARSEVAFIRALMNSLKNSDYSIVKLMDVVPEEQLELYRRIEELNYPGLRNDLGGLEFIKEQQQQHDFTLENPTGSWSKRVPFTPRIGWDAQWIRNN